MTVGRVIRVEPGGGTMLATGGTVTLVVSTGPKPAPPGAPADGRADAGADPLILGEAAVRRSPCRSFQVRARPQPISAVAPGRVA